MAVRKYPKTNTLSCIVQDTPARLDGYGGWRVGTWFPSVCTVVDFSALGVRCHGFRDELVRVSGGVSCPRYFVEHGFGTAFPDVACICPDQASMKRPAGFEHKHWSLSQRGFPSERQVSSIYRVDRELQHGDIREGGGIPVFRYSR